MFAKYTPIAFLILVTLIFSSFLVIKNILATPAQGSTIVKSSSIDLKTAPFGVDPPDQNDIQIDNQSQATIIGRYRPDLSKDRAVFDITIKDADYDLTPYNYNKNIVLADTNIVPLPHEDIYIFKKDIHELDLRFTTQKYIGGHFHLLIENEGGIKDRVLHYYHSV